MSAIHKVSEYVSPAPAEPSRLLEEVIEETRATDRAERSFVERLSAMAEAETIFERRTRLIEACYMVAIGRTRPTDWVLFKDPEGNVHAMLAASGAQLIAEVYGIKLSNVRPRDDKGLFEPERVTYGPTAFAYRGACDAWSRINGREQSIEITRRSDEDFTGRTVDAEGRFSFDKEKRVGAFEGDLRSSVLTGLLTKAVRVLCGMTRVPTSDLERAWAGSKKSIDQCRKGHGFGTSAGRNAGGLVEEDVKAEVEKLRAEVGRCVGGDVSAARKLVKEITSGPNFAGFDTLDRVTKEFQVKQAWVNLRKHPLFGQATGKTDAKPEPREAGQEG